MRIQQQSTLNAQTNIVPQDTSVQNQNQGILTDVTNIRLAINGNLRFGPGSTGTNGENIDGQWLTFTSGTSNLTNNLSHTLGSIPVGYLVTNINKPAIIYSSGTLSTGTTVYLCASTNNVTATVFLIG